MTAKGGYMGKILFVNLTDRTFYEEKLDDQVYRSYMSGYGLGARILFERLRPGTDPFGPENYVGMVAGIFVGTKMHAAGRFNAVGKSPLTGGWGDASCGGKFGPKIKAAGYDGIFFYGTSAAPVTVYISDEKVEFHDATALWGKNTEETEQALQDQFGKDAAVATIGQAGELRSCIAGIFTDHGRAAARMGLGGVMGSKKLKAVVLSGSQSVDIADPDKYDDVIRELKTQITAKRNQPGGFRFGNYGTTGVYFNNVNIHDAPVQNWKYTRKNRFSLEQAEKLAGPAYLPYVKKRYACAQCPVACGAILELEDESGQRYQTHRPEYETIGVFGSLLLIDDFDTVCRANELCNRYGLDTISTGGTIAFVMECYEHGIFTEEELDGIEPEWGNHNCVIPLIHKMALRDGFLGEIMADGSKAAAEKLGRGSEQYVVTAGGVEMPMHDPRCWPGFGYGYALDPTPGHHCQGTVGFMEHGWKDAELMDSGVEYDHSQLPATKYDFENKGYYLKILNNWFHFFNGTGMCILARYAGYFRYPMIDCVKAVTGWDDLTMGEALITGERINTVRHLFNVREGINHKDFALPERVIGNPPLPDGPTAGVTIPQDEIRIEYYKELGWNLESDMPSEETLEKLGLTDLVKAAM
ncbi:MAG: aldehyde ferredoxin oxidoreductase family protein [Anaerolineaceae bacterium]